MNNNVLKLIVCIGVFCTNFGMEKEQAIARMPQQKLYVQHNYTIYDCHGDDTHVVRYRSIGKNGCHFDIKSLTQNKIESAIRFKSCFLVLQNQEYYVKAGSDYSSSVIAKAKNILDADLLPVEFTREQLQEVIRLIDTKGNEVFVLDEYDQRLDIVDVSRKVALSVQSYITQQATENYRNYRENYRNYHVSDDPCVIS